MNVFSFVILFLCVFFSPFIFRFMLFYALSTHCSRFCFSSMSIPLCPCVRHFLIKDWFWAECVPRPAYIYIYRLLSHVLWSEYHTSSEYRIYLPIDLVHVFIYISTGSIELPLNYVHRHKFYIISLHFALTRSVGRSFDACAGFCSKIVFGFHIKSCRTF